MNMELLCLLMYLRNKRHKEKVLLHRAPSLKSYRVYLLLEPLSFSMSDGFVGQRKLMTAKSLLVLAHEPSKNNPMAIDTCHVELYQT